MLLTISCVLAFTSSELVLVLGQWGSEHILSAFASLTLFSSVLNYDWNIFTWLEKHDGFEASAFGDIWWDLSEPAHDFLQEKKFLDSNWPEFIILLMEVSSLLILYEQQKKMKVVINVITAASGCFVLALAAAQLTLAFSKIRSCVLSLLTFCHNNKMRKLILER